MICGASRFEVNIGKDVFFFDKHVLFHPEAT